MYIEFEYKHTYPHNSRATNTILFLLSTAIELFITEFISVSFLNITILCPVLAPDFKRLIGLALVNCASESHKYLKHTQDLEYKATLMFENNEHRKSSWCRWSRGE